MITFTATATFPEESITFFAESNGWDELRYPETTPEEFVREYFNKILIDTIAKPTHEQIKKEKKLEEKQSIQEYNDTLSQVISVSSE